MTDILQTQVKRKLVVEPLTRGAFAPFGDVIETTGRDYFMINNGSTRRYHNLAVADVDDGSRAIISIFQLPAQLSIDIEMLERHPKGSQAFIPLSGNPYFIVVAPAGDEPDPKAIRAFYAKGNQGINYHKGVWHHPVLVLEDKDQFLIVDRDGEGSNCDEHFFADGTAIVLTLD